MAKQVAPARRPAGATIIWLLMILGIALTATLAGKLLHPFSFGLLVRVVSGIALGALVLATVAVIGIERAGKPEAAPAAHAAPFLPALREIWAEPQSRRFAIFVFVSMLAYSAQELILEPFAGAVFALDPAHTARLTGLQHGGVLCGMLLVAIAGVNVYLLKSLVSFAKASPSLEDDAIFLSEMSLALYLLPAMFGGIGINVVSHILVSHLVEAERKFKNEKPDA